jgi:hypothetical protein
MGTGVTGTGVPDADVTGSATNTVRNSSNNNGNNYNGIMDNTDIHEYNKNDKKENDFVDMNGSNNNSDIFTTTAKESLNGHDVDNKRQDIYDDAKGCNDYEDKSSCVRPCASTASIPLRPCASTTSIPVRPCVSTTSISVSTCGTTFITVSTYASTASIPVRPCASTASIPVRINDYNNQQRTDFYEQKEGNDHLKVTNNARDTILNIHEKIISDSKDKEGVYSDDDNLNNDDNINNIGGNNDINATDNRYKNDHDHNDHYEDSNKVETYTQESVIFDYDEGDVQIFEHTYIHGFIYLYIYISISICFIYMLK